MVDKVLTVENELNTVPLAAKVVIYLTPVVTAILSKMEIENDALRTAIAMYMKNSFMRCSLILGF